jgi:Ca2+-binding EF-hand superfamily protein
MSAGSSSAISQWRQQIFQKLDANGDGSVDKSEFENALQTKGVGATQADQLFAKMDKDGDGSVSQAEFAKGAHRGHHHRQVDQTQASSDSASASGSSSSLTDLFSQIDSDGDGSVSKAEFEAFGQKLSSQMTGALIAGQDVSGGGFGFDMGPPPPFGAQAYGQAASWGGNYGSSDNQQQNAADALLQQMLATMSV